MATKPQSRSSGLRPLPDQLKAANEPSKTEDERYTEGTVIAEKYRLIRRLGAGGMGSVWEAKNEPLDSTVALKLIQGSDESGRLARRLLQEARTAARLGHPAIVRVFDLGTTEHGDPFLVMELLDGSNMAEHLAERGRQNAAAGVQILLPIVHALAMTHEKGIVHRDLKPENIILSRTDDGRIQPKLVDFGIVKADDKGFERITQLGSVIGSPAYISPEQARGFDVDHRADVWATCVVLFETITGRPPFEGKNYNALLRSIIEDAPQPTTSFAAGDDQLWAILEKGLAKKPSERWQNMRDLGTALARWLLDRGVSEDVVGASLQAVWLQYGTPGPPAVGAPPDGPSRQSLVDIQTVVEAPAVAAKGEAAGPAWRLPALVAAGVIALGLIGYLIIGAVVGEPTAEAPPSEPGGTAEGEVPAVSPTAVTQRPSGAADDLPSPASSALPLAPEGATNAPEPPDEAVEPPAAESASAPKPVPRPRPRFRSKKPKVTDLKTNF